MNSNDDSIANEENESNKGCAQSHLSGSIDTHEPRGLAVSVTPLQELLTDFLCARLRLSMPEQLPTAAIVARTVRPGSSIANVKLCRERRGINPSFQPKASERRYRKIAVSDPRSIIPWTKKRPSRQARRLLPRKPPDLRGILECWADPRVNGTDVRMGHVEAYKVLRAGRSSGEIRDMHAPRKRKRSDKCAPASQRLTVPLLLESFLHP
jgi:hypothetical protein